MANQLYNALFFKRRKNKRDANELASQGIFAVKSTSDLLAANTGKINVIKNLVSIDQNYFDQLYMKPLANLVEFCQSLPASEYHHHSYPGGLIAHLLDVASRALSVRQGKLLPVGATPEQIGKENQVWTYAVFTAALLHDIGKPFADIKVSLLDEKLKPFAKWKPFISTMEQTGAAYYMLDYVRDASFKRNYRFHELVGFLFLQKIITPVGLDWISNYPVLFEQWLNCVLNRETDDNEVYQLVKQADCDSVAADLNNHESKHRVNSKTRSLPERIVMKLRQLIEERSLIINERGCQGWVSGDYAYMVIKPTIDAIRESMQAEGQAGMPHNNIRVIDELQGSGYIKSHSVDGKQVAKFIVDVDAPTWDKSISGLSVLKFPLSLVFPKDKMPDSFAGTVEVINCEPEQVAASANEQASQEPATSHITTEPSYTAAKAKASTEPESEKTTVIKSQATKTQTATAVKLEPDNNSDNTQPSQPDKTSQIQQQPTSPARQKALEFLKWLKDGLENKSIIYNDSVALVHIVEEGVFLVSPKIFKHFDEKEWSLLQKGFLRLRISARTNTNNNIFAYVVDGKNIIKGMVIPIDNYERAFGPGFKTPKVNPKLVKSTF